MPKYNVLNVKEKTVDGQGNYEEVQSLLTSAADEEFETEAQRGFPPNIIRLKSQRQPSLLRPLENGFPRTPRTANRVRFDVLDGSSNENVTHEDGRDAPNVREWIEDEDFLSNNLANGSRSSTSQAAPLLTDIEAPSITVATADLDFNAEDLLESARPKSGMSSAFMNMANSIM